MPPITPITLGDLAWRVARNCNGGNCVRVASSRDIILIGDSKHPEGPALSYSREEFAAFVRGIREGDFDDLL
jgi:metallophosphoesterase superfamily enzyme